MTGWHVDDETLRRYVERLPLRLVNSWLQIMGRRADERQEMATNHRKAAPFVAVCRPAEASVRSAVLTEGGLVANAIGPHKRVHTLTRTDGDCQRHLLKHLSPVSRPCRAKRGRHDNYRWGTTRITYEAKMIQESPKSSL